MTQYGNDGAPYYLSSERGENLTRKWQTILFALVAGSIFFAVLFFHWYSHSYGNLPMKEIEEMNMIDSENVTVTRAHFEQMLSANRSPMFPRFDYLLRFSGTKVTLTPTDLLVIILCIDGTFNQELFEEYKSSPYIRIEYSEQRRLFSIGGMDAS